MFADQDFYDICLNFFDPMTSATAYGQMPKFVRAEQSATAEGENCTYGPTLHNLKAVISGGLWSFQIAATKLARFNHQNQMFVFYDILKSISTPCFLNLWPNFVGPALYQFEKYT